MHSEDSTCTGKVRCERDGCVKCCYCDLLLKEDTVTHAEQNEADTLTAQLDELKKLEPKLRELDQASSSYAEARGIYVRLKELVELRGAADMASEDLTKVPAFQDEYLRLIARLKELGYLKDEQTEYDFLASFGPAVQGIMPRNDKEASKYPRLNAINEAPGKKKLTPEQFKTLWPKDMPLPRPPLKLQDFAGIMGELCKKVDYFFKLEDIYDICERCLVGGYDLEAAIRLVQEAKKRVAYLITDEEGTPHGLYLHKAMANHYEAQFEKVGQKVKVLEVPICDYSRVTKLQAYELNFLVGSITDTGSFYTLNPSAFVKVPVVGWKHCEAVHKNDVERMKVIVPEEGSKAYVEEFLSSVCSKYSFIDPINDTYIARLK